MRGLNLFLLLSLMLVGARCEARPLWPMPPLSSFDGARWGDLRLGQTTFRQIQAGYETGKGAFERSTELTRPKNTPLRIDLLWDKRGGDEVLEAIAIRFEGVGPNRMAVEKLFDPQSGAANHYPNTRFEAWRVASFAARGVAFFTLSEAQNETAPLLLLTFPRALNFANLPTQPTEVEERIDPHQNEPKIAEFGRIEVEFSDSDDDLALSSREKERVRDAIEYTTAAGTLRFRVGSAGKYQVNATGRDGGKRGGSVSATVSIEANGPYGTIRATGSDSDSWSWTKKEQENGEHRNGYELNRRLRDSFRDAVSAARREAEASFARQMEQSGPPPLEQVREGQWREIIENLRKSGRNEALYPLVLR